jgi:Na+:H+ antiporter, NhaA family
MTDAGPGSGAPSNNAGSPRRADKKLDPVGLVASTFGAVVHPIQTFLRLEAASGILLFIAAVAALAWANSPFRESYQAFFESPVALASSGGRVQFSLRAFINDGLMTVFFFVVGLEIKRELVTGELSTVKKAMLPALAAVGGMVVPALFFVAFTRGTPAQSGWGIPMATDIAFSIGCLTLLGKRVPHALVVFLTALAVFDDIGGILVIAIFYGHGLGVWWLVVAAALTLGLAALNRLHVRSAPAYLLLGGALWYALHHAGIHATIAGVILGLGVPALTPRRARTVLEELSSHTKELLESPVNDELDGASILQIEEKLEDLQPPLQRFVHNLHPWVAYVIMPVFALANAGVYVREMSMADLGAGVTIGTGLGLLLGKPLGIVLATYLAVRSRAAALPDRVGWWQILGVGTVAGIGFTVALFIATLAFAGEAAILALTKVGILLGSLLAGIIGLVILRVAPAPNASEPYRGLDRRQ